MQHVRGVSGPILGHFRGAWVSSLTTGMGAGGIVWVCQWATQQNIRAAITRLKCSAKIVTPFTAAQEIELLAYLLSSYTVAATGGSASIPAAGKNSFLQCVESGYGSQFSDIRVGSGIAAGTWISDVIPFIGASGAQLQAAASAVQDPVLFDFDANSDQRQPIILQGGGPTSHGSGTNVATNAQGIQIQTLIAQGAGGTVRFIVEMEWLEFAWDSAETIS